MFPFFWGILCTLFLCFSPGCASPFAETHQKMLVSCVRCAALHVSGFQISLTCILSVMTQTSNPVRSSGTSIRQIWIHAFVSLCLEIDCNGINKQTNKLPIGKNILYCPSCMCPCGILAFSLTLGHFFPQDAFIHLSVQNSPILVYPLVFNLLSSQWSLDSIIITNMNMPFSCVSDSSPKFTIWLLGFDCHTSLDYFS